MRQAAVEDADETIGDGTERLVVRLTTAAVVAIVSAYTR